ncbi:hypothetical protein PSAR109036_05865 [Psychrobacter arenosus]|uniref:hypothetical protein n=1 Tax=Psychrobacter arenosus TaxID=256326 RepID=UPI001917F8F4|nr:hypothetical protein [Psychrobacter arenosus]
MKIIDYDKLFEEFRPNGYFSEDANTIANTLLCALYVQAGYGLAHFLNVETFLDNHAAMRVWVQKRLDAQDSYLISDMCSQLESELYGLLPNTGYESY